MRQRFTQALQQLLPTGFAWPRNPRSVLMRVLHGVAAAFDELHQFVLATAQQWLPHQTTLRLREWEEACGLPDSCLGPDQTESVRRVALLTRLRGVQLPYTDSSHAAPEAIRSLCAGLGYTVQRVAYNLPLRVGVDQVGKRLGQRTDHVHGGLVRAGGGCARRRARTGLPGPFEGARLAGGVLRMRLPSGWRSALDERDCDLR